MEQRERLEKEYRDWLIDSSNLKLLPKEKKQQQNGKKTILDANANNVETEIDKLSID